MESISKSNSWMDTFRMTRFKNFMAEAGDAVTSQSIINLKKISMSLNDYGHETDKFSYILTQDPELHRVIKQLALDEEFDGPTYSKIVNATAPDYNFDGSLNKKERQIREFTNTDVCVIMHFTAHDYELGFDIHSFNFNHKPFFLHADNRFFKFEPRNDTYEVKEVDNNHWMKFVEQMFCNFSTFTKMVSFNGLEVTLKSGEFSELKSWILFK